MNDAVAKPKRMNPMKTTKLLVTAALLTGFAALSYAGPSPDYWARFEKERATARAKATAQTKTPAAPAVAACANCDCPAMKKS